MQGIGLLFGTGHVRSFQTRDGSPILLWCPAGAGPAWQKVSTPTQPAPAPQATPAGRRHSVFARTSADQAKAGSSSPRNPSGTPAPRQRASSYAGQGLGWGGVSRHKIFYSVLQLPELRTRCWTCAWHTEPGSSSSVLNKQEKDLVNHRSGFALNSTGSR